MLAWPYLILKGWLPYRDIAIAHTPLMLLVLTAFYKIFGVGILQLKVFTWLLMAFNTLLTFWVAKKVFNKKTALLAAILYLPLSIYYKANGLWFDLALVPFALLLYYFVTKNKFIASGVVYALGILTKQTFIYFALAVVTNLIQKERKDSLEIPKKTIEKIRKFIFGAVLAFLLPIIVMFFIGILDDFYFWAVNFGILYLPSVSGQIKFPDFGSFIVAIVPFTILFFDLSFLPWVIAGLMGVYPRWELFHFQPALPFLAIVISKIYFAKKNRLLVYGYLLITILLVTRGIYREVKSSTRFYEQDVVNVSDEVKNHNAKEIYVVNYWDNIYSLSGTVPVTKPLIPYIPWYLDLGGARESIMINLKENFPDALVVKDRQNLSWSELEDFLIKYYQCRLVENEVELCLKNK